MIKINKIKIANFRSFKNEGNILDSLSGINVFVGKNNVGKTNILRAIYLFFNPESYDILKDRNMIKQLTAGQSRDPKITIDIEDDEIIKGSVLKYSISCNLNSSRTNGELYTVSSRSKDVKLKLNSTSKIRDYIKKHIKCIYLSTTDEDIEAQTNALIDDLILEYFKKQNKEIKDTISRFEAQYKVLMKTFESNIGQIENNLAAHFTGMKDMGVTPKLIINSSREITGFLLENIKLQLDDAYVQDIGNKGAGIQRASLIMLSLFLLNEIYKKQNKVILLDEPEAYLYPLLVKRIKGTLEENVVNSSGFQMFVTSHSREFLSEINNSVYSFHYLTQKREMKEYQRSKNDSEVNKFSVIQPFDRKNRYEVLKNYGLLDEVNDYPYVIVCEGETDKNYLMHILRDKEDIPQIRFEKYTGSISGKELDLKYDYIGKGAKAIPNILVYLEKISNVPRKVLVLLDGDQEGKEVEKKIKPAEFHNLEVKVFILPDGKTIEDVVFTKEDFINRVLQYSDTLSAAKYRPLFEEVINSKQDNKSVIAVTEAFIVGNNISGERMPRIKSVISQNLEDVEVQSDWIMPIMDEFFYKDYIEAYEQTIPTTVVHVLKSQTKGLSIQEITQIMIDQDLYSFATKNPNNVVNKAVQRHCDSPNVADAAKDILFHKELSETGEEIFYLLTDTE